eukprot:XP_003729663.1 PREDICTED: ankyrin repeat, PH and SEC7 domain containing protein secG-like [Strongylocentrotus purpuratus]
MAQRAANEPNEDDTPLNKAAFKGNLDLVQYLISQGAEVIKSGNDGLTPLHYASITGYIDVVKYLIRQGAEVDQGEHDVRYLISHGAEVNKGDNNGMAPLHCASINNRLDIVKYLISQGAQIDQHNDKGVTALHYAKLSSHRDIVQYLRSEQARRKEPSPEDDTDDNKGNGDQLTSLKHDSGSNRDYISFGGLSAPPEILARGPRARRAYAEAAQAGTKKVFRTRLMLVGQERVGKTSLKKTLTGQR